MSKATDGCCFSRLLRWTLKVSSASGEIHRTKVSDKPSRFWIKVKKRTGKEWAVARRCCVPKDSSHRQPRCARSTGDEMVFWRSLCSFCARDSAAVKRLGEKSRRELAVFLRRDWI